VDGGITISADFFAVVFFAEFFNSKDIVKNDDIIDI
jgi:hypothetical protein